MYRMYGVHPARRFYDIYGKHIAKKVGNPDITFKQVSTSHFIVYCPEVVCVSASHYIIEYEYIVKHSERS